MRSVNQPVQISSGNFGRSVHSNHAVNMIENNFMQALKFVS